MASLYQMAGISEQTQYRWKTYDGMKAEGAQRLAKREEKNARLKKLFAETLMEMFLIHGIPKAIRSANG